MRKVFLAAVGVALSSGSFVAVRGRRGSIAKSVSAAHDVAMPGGEDHEPGRTGTRRDTQVAVDKTDCKLSLQPAQSGSCTFTTAGTFTFNDPTMKGSKQRGAPSPARSRGRAEHARGLHRHVPLADDLR